MATLDQVEKLREHANVSYDEAKEALDATGGDILEALIDLEKKGKAKPPQGGGFYSNEKVSEPKSCCPETVRAARGESFTDVLKRFGRFLLKVLQKGNTNLFQVEKNGEVKVSLPVTILVLLLLFAFWITLPLMIVGLFFGLRYRFVGPDLGKESVNSAMDSVAKATDDLKHSIKDDK